MMPILFALGNYYFVGLRYFTDGRVFLLGTVLIFFLYILAIFSLTSVVRWVIARYPDVRRATRRMLIMLGLVTVLTGVLAVLGVFLYSLFPVLEVRFAWVSIRPIMVLGLIIGLFLCTVLNAYYTHTQWHKDQTENEQLRQATLQNQLDALKMKINPHFLFNSLNSLSSLISDDQQEAEQFLDEMAKVYRYLLQANNRAVVNLQTELGFVASYTYLLQTRYGASLQIEQAIDPVFIDYVLPPLTLQTLIDNAIKHNAMSPSNPLSITIRTTPAGYLRVQNNLQRKSVRMDLYQAKLANLIAKYRMISNEEVLVSETETAFDVAVPLLNGVPSIKP